MTRLIFTLIAAICIFAAGLASPLAHAGPNGQRYASIAVDADSNEILHARQIDAPRFPASLTKMMTLYLTFDAIESGALSLDEKMTVSRRATAQPPVKLGLRAGQKISVHDAVRALAVKSSNDVALVLAERLGGSEEQFARMMTQKARSIGMASTTYRNASGLPDEQQVTTARDQAKLADSLLRTHRRHYHYFGQETFTWRGRTLRNHNTLLGSVRGVDGFKTGFTNGSGYNLTISAQRDGRRIIAVVLGGATGAARDEHMATLIERAFDVISDRPVNIAARQAQTLPAISTGALPSTASLRGRDSARTVKVVFNNDGAPIPVLSNKPWAIQIGAFNSEATARAHAQSLQGDTGLPLADTQITVSPLAQASGKVLHRARLSGLTAGHAQSVCKTLASAAQPCLVIAPNHR